MRTSRVLGDPAVESHFYHVMSRAIEGRMIFDEVAKEKFRSLLAGQLAFSGLRMVTFCVMGNHFHLLVEVPTGRDALRAMSDAAFLERLATIYSEDFVDEVSWQLEAFRSDGMEAQAEALRERFFARMHDLPAFMRELKQRFTQWHNRRAKRRGPLWQDRYKSVLVEDSDTAVRTMAAYIDLNPIRARLVEDPKDYRWSGYGEAVAGVGSSREGLSGLVRSEGGGTGGADSGTASWAQIQAIYRCWLYDQGEQEHSEEGAMLRPGFSASQREAVLAEEGALARRVLVKARVRYFTDGVAIGSKGFLEEVFSHRRAFFSERRIDGARRMKGVRWGGLMNLRDLRSEVGG